MRNMYFYANFACASFCDLYKCSLFTVSKLLCIISLFSLIMVLTICFNHNTFLKLFKLFHLAVVSRWESRKRVGIAH